MKEFGIDGITHHDAVVNGVRLHYVKVGEENENASPLVLLHGFPQSWVMWRRVMSALARNRLVVAADLRGYGDSEKPSTGHDQGTKAADIHGLIEHLKFDRFVMVGHDRGGRVARRYALDHPEKLVGLVLLDILPAEYVYDEMSAAEVAQRYWHWIFQIVPDLPERLIVGKEDAYLERFFGRAPGQLERLKDDGAYAEYHRAFLQSGAVSAALNDYRETFEVDVPRYRKEREAGLKVSVPTLLLWGDRGNLKGLPVEKIWSEVVENIVGVAEIPDCGHYLPEESPQLVTEHVLRFADARLDPEGA